mgnify:CR=1 FL=1
MPKYYKSKFYDSPIEVLNDNWDVSVTIKDCFGRKSIYSWYNLEDKNSQSHYINKCLLGGFLQQDIKNILVIWVWWGAFVKYLEDHVPGVTITGIEIDEAMIEIAQKELNIKSKDMIVWDISDVIDQLSDRGAYYDLILFDVYWWTWEIPKSVTNNDLFLKLKSLLENDWIFSINYSNFYPLWESFIDISVSKYYKTIHKSLQDVFWGNFLAFLSGESEWGNVAGIYNLKKKHTLNEIKSIYYKKVQSNEIILDSRIIEWIYLDNLWNFLA